jgi:hypothetical protein
MMNERARFSDCAKRWSVRGTALLLAAFASAASDAQTAPCGLTSITESTPLAYPPIARAAHVQGPVVLLATFERDGSVSRVKIVSAPLLLDQLMGRVAADFVKGWKANSFSGPRECPVVVQFVIGAETNNPKVSVSRIDSQHVRIIAEMSHPTINYSIASK